MEFRPLNVPMECASHTILHIYFKQKKKLFQLVKRRGYFRDFSNSPWISMLFTTECNVTCTVTWMYFTCGLDE